MPLIYNRFILNWMTPPLIGAPHLDLLPPARRLWKARWGSCSLGSLERNVLGLQRTTEDVPGYLIPDIYRQYYLTGVATEMLAPGLLPQPAGRRVDGAAGRAQWRGTSARRGLDDRFATLDPLECVSLARCYEAWLGRDQRPLLPGRARTLVGDRYQVLALRELSLLFKRLRLARRGGGVVGRVGDDGRRART